MIKIITHTPVYVWVILYLLIFRGIKARKTTILSLKTYPIVPLLFFFWVCYSLFTHDEISAKLLVLWIFSLGVGAAIGYRMMQKLNIRFDKKKKLIKLPGSWVPLILSMSIFVIQYFVNVAYALHPELTSNGTFLPLELLNTAITGCFIGRLVGCLRKYKQASHENLDIKK